MARLAGRCFTCPGSCAVWPVLTSMWPPEFRRQIVEGEKKFEEIAKTESDCSSARNGGDLGPFTRGMMQKPFEDATWVLGGIRFAGWPHLFVVLPGLG